MGGAGLGGSSPITKENSNQEKGYRFERGKERKIRSRDE
jgi:hypothetical protein